MADDTPKTPEMETYTPTPDRPQETSVPDRLRAVLTSIKTNARHNAPIAPGDIAELEAIVAASTGTVMVVKHDLTKTVLIRKPDGTVTAAETAEDAVDYIKALPADVSDRPHWVVAERSLLAAIDSGGDVGVATTAFADALSEDRKLSPVTRKPDELLPDGRIREDRFPDRRPPVAPEGGPQEGPMASPPPAEPVAPPPPAEPVAPPPQ